MPKLIDTTNTRGSVERGGRDQTATSGEGEVSRRQGLSGRDEKSERSNGKSEGMAKGTKKGHQAPAHKASTTVKKNTRLVETKCGNAVENL